MIYVRGVYRVKSREDNKAKASAVCPPVVCQLLQKDIVFWLRAWTKKYSETARRWWSSGLPILRQKDKIEPPTKCNEKQTNNNEQQSHDTLDASLDWT